MNADDYLAQVRRGLKGFLPEQQQPILDEIASHIQAGEEDEMRGADQPARHARVLAEMGAPQQMGSGFHAVYRPNRWLDLLLILIPLYVLAPLLRVVYWRVAAPSVDWNTEVYQGISLRIAIFIALALTLIASQRRSLLLFAFWAPDAITRLAVLITREQRWRSGFDSTRGAHFPLETLLYMTLLAGLGYWLARTLWKNRTDYLILVFALQPLIGSLFGWLTTAYSLEYGIQARFPAWQVGSFTVQLVIEVLSLVGFVLLRPRDLRWLALFTGMASYTALMLVAYWPNLALTGIWLLNIALVAVLWALDWRARLALPKQVVG